MKQAIYQHMSNLNCLHNVKKYSLLTNASEIGGIMYEISVRVYSGL